ncbi:MAG: class II glutamine amidotransferase [Planctomycetota bacterium]
MCRWLAYSGAPLVLSKMLFGSEHGLIEQSLHARQSTETTQGDGFGIGWYGGRERPGLFRSVLPAWNDRNLRDLAEQVEAPLFLAHVRRSTGTMVQQTNCHPFRHGRWLFVHNGLVRELAALRRDLVLGVPAELFDGIEGTTDSEILFHLALGFGLEHDPVPALQRMAGYVEEVGARHGIERPLRMTLGVSDGRRLIAVRYSSDGDSPTLYRSRSVVALEELMPAEENLHHRACVIVSEPLDDLVEDWVALPEGSVLLLADGRCELRTFAAARSGA